MAEATTTKTLIQKTIQSNLLIQEFLTTQAAQVAAQLEELDQLIVRGCLLKSFKLNVLIVE